jgi:hypothetical protein
VSRGSALFYPVKSKVDAVANHLVTGEEIPGLSERTASQDLQLVGRVCVG